MNEITLFCLGHRRGLTVAPAENLHGRRDRHTPGGENHNDNMLLLPLGDRGWLLPAIHFDLPVGVCKGIREVRGSGEPTAGAQKDRRTCARATHPIRSNLPRGQANGRRARTGGIASNLGGISSCRENTLACALNKPIHRARWINYIYLLSVSRNPGPLGSLVRKDPSFVFSFFFRLVTAHFRPKRVTEGASCEISVTRRNRQRL